MFRAGARPPGAAKGKLFRFGGGGLFGLYTRWPVAIEPWKSRLFYFHWTQPANWFQKMWYKFLYNTMYRWLVEYNFSIQDGSMMFEQRYDHPEKLSGTDAEIIQWRKLIVTRHYGGRDAEFGVGHGRSLKEIEEQAVAAPADGLVFGSEMQLERSVATGYLKGKSGGRRAAATRE